MADYAPIKPQEITLKDVDGDEHTYVISRFPATVGREIIAKYPITNIPKLGEYLQSEAAMMLLMSFVSKVLEDGTHLRLETRALIDNHVPDGELLLKLEFEMFRYNTSFFGIVGSSDFVPGLVKKYLPLIMQTLTDYLALSSPPDLPRSSNSEQSTTSKTP